MATATEQALDSLVLKHLAHPDEVEQEVTFTEAGKCFELRLLLETPELRKYTLGYVSLHYREQDLESEEFSLEQAHLRKLERWLQELVWDVR